MIIGKRCFVIFFLTVLLFVPAFAIGESPDISKGHRILVDSGLQILARVFVRDTGYFDTDLWAQSNFTTVDMDTYYPDALMPSPPGIPWSRWLGREGTETDLRPTERSYISNLIRLQVGDEQNIADSATLPSIAATVADLQAKYPGAIVHTNQPGPTYTVAQLQNYMAVVQPDMLMFDDYPFDAERVGGSPAWYYNDLEKYRLLGLAGNDGTGTKPIPVGTYMQTFYSDQYTDGHRITESEIRLDNFAAWAFGCKLVNGLVYDNPARTSAILPVMFEETTGTSEPTAQFYQVAETNRQSLNVGKSLVRLISTDVRMIMGEHEESFGTVTWGETNPLPSRVSNWSSSADPYITNITASNLGDTNDGYRGDVIVGYFKPLDPVFTDPGHEDDMYFMIVNGLSDPSGSAYDCRQQICLDFDFGSSGINQLLRISRDTGEIETVPLQYEGGSQYSLDLILDGGTGDLFKFDNGGRFVTQPDAPEVHYTFKETSAGVWEVLVDITGGTAGLTSYEFWVDGVNPGTVSFTENILGTLVNDEYLGFSSDNVLSSEMAGSFNVGNWQGSLEAAIEGIGMSEVFIDGTDLVDLDAQALLGILHTEAGLTEENFRAVMVGLLNEFGDGFYDADEIVPTVDVIPLEVLLPGDANRDGVVSAGDYASVQANFGNTGQAGIPGDANGDGVVSADDYAAIQANFGNTASGFVPEPATMSLLMIGFGIFRKKRAEN